MTSWEGKMIASGLMSKNVFSVQQTATCEAAARLMWEGDVGSVPVLDDNQRVVGIITDRDICMSAYTRGQRLEDIPVRVAMAKNVICARDTDDISVVEKLMQQHQVRRVPVCDRDGRVVGMVAF